MEEVRVRFAPSPTGYLHVGGARTALFNWLYARQKGGTMVLRVEDTDKARSTEESVEGILEGMRFLGLTWDEGPVVGGAFSPYFQSERLESYQEHAKLLREKKRAYPCFCTPEELDAIRKERAEKNEPPVYDGRCRHLQAAEAERRIQEKIPFVLRFAPNTEGVTVIPDRIRGEVTFENKYLDDFVIVKGDGMPTYNFAVVVDDALMKITHVIRGEDHLSNTPKQIALYDALCYPVPVFAHIPMILGSDKTRLSKRHGATSVTQFRDEGYVPSAMVNYLALLGWGYDDSQTLFTIPDLIAKFSLERVSKNPAVFDMAKLEWMNGTYIRELGEEELFSMVLPFWQEAGFVSFEPTKKEVTEAKKVALLLQSRLKYLKDVVQDGAYFFRDTLTFNEKAEKKVLRKEGVAKLLERLAHLFSSLEDLSQKNVEPLILQVQEEFQIPKLGDVMQPIRVSVTGTNVSPGMYEVLELLGKERTCKRLLDAAARCNLGGGLS